MFFDSHCHLTDDKLFPQLLDVLWRAKAANVTRILSVATDLDDALAIQRFADGHTVWATAGIHPQNALSWDENSAEKLRVLAQNSSVVAIGEIGLDFLYDETHAEFPGATRKQQKAVFEAQLEMAAELKLPIVIHNRFADDALLEIVAAHRDGLVGGVFHCFGSPPEIARRVLDLDFYLGFTGLVTFKNAGEVRESALLCPRNRLLIETDAPYLAPVPFRGKTNEPAMVAQIGAKIGELWGLSAPEAGEITAANTRKLLEI